MKFSKFSAAIQLFLHVTDNFTIRLEIQEKVQYCDKEVEHKAVMLKRNETAEYLKIYGSYKEVSETKVFKFLHQLQWFLFEKKWIDVLKDTDSQFYSWSHHFLYTLAFLKHFKPHPAANILQILTSFNF